MTFKHHDPLRLFTIVAKYSSMTDASEELHITKGAVSHQIRQLEQAIGFSIFERNPRGISLTQRGRELLICANRHYAAIEDTIDNLRDSDARILTVGSTTYFASRWLSPRLMEFLPQHPEIQLRLQPMIELVDLKRSGIDLAVRWGDGNWNDVESMRLFDCPVWPCGGASIQEKVHSFGLERVLSDATLLHDREESAAWSEWFSAAGLHYHNPHNTLIIPDPNVRVQAVIDGQGIALNDKLVEQECQAGQLFRLSSDELRHYGYHLVWPRGARFNNDELAFSHWIQSMV